VFEKKMVMELFLLFFVKKRKEGEELYVLSLITIGYNLILLSP
jgi:hypothetical protein